MVTKLADLEVYLVGGAVRDQLLGRKVLEHDYMVVGASQQQMLDLGFQQVGKDFPVFLHPETKDEYALARTERKQGQGYTGFICYAEPDVTLEQDLIRRDLTVNAMAQAPNGDLIDPYHGQQDLDNRILRHVSPAFSEDPLRVLRVARFAARYHQYGFTIADDTLELMTNIATSGELKALSAERVWKEMERALTEPNPEVFIEVLRACGALKELWPELDKLWGIPNPVEHHPEICSGEHTMLVLKQAVKLSAEPKVRFAALCHDLGKGLTPEAKWPKHYGHELAGVKVIEQVAARLKVPNDYKLLAAKVSQFHLNVHRAFELKPSTVLKLLEQCEYQRKPELLANILLVCRADSLGRMGAEHNDYPQADYIAELANVGKQVIAKPFVEQGLQGKAIKEAMTAAKINVIAEKKAELLAKLS
ncbi:multifunctional CCA addition/repair protein [Thalassotalea euphylliae]|uniref:Multifunctional CCA protein n=1 Tax=Thalassotalea euphylliae TaxID=1655234 RepID=A0A3E0U640_9GAMM|nr:multifunctional CCA addition/repair protein [Thalassotalea euphylliae]REL32023.1 multifunctional CCA addition/repair protein [Thalassotalea euphylliae]